MLTSEQMVIGVLLGDPRTIRTIRAELDAEDFQSEDGRAIFRAACALDDDGVSADPVLIRQKALEQGHELDRRGMIEAMEVSAVGSLDTHIQGMKEARLRSGLLDAVSSANIRLMSEVAPAAVCADLQAEIQTVLERDTAHGLESSAGALSRFVDHRIEIESGKRRAFVPTGFNSLDNSLGGGMVQSGFYVLGARPGCGKTSMGLQIAEKAAAAGISTLFISLEMPVVQLTARRLAEATGIPAGRILLHGLDDDENARIADAMSTLSKRPLFFNRAHRATVGSVGVLARQVKDCGLVVLDYLGLLQHEHGKSMYERVTLTSNALKRLALVLGIPILCLAQLNREVEGRNSPPRLSDLRDSGAIEQDADGVLLLHKPPFEDDGIGPAPLVCTVAKNRHGPSGKEIEFNWYMKSGRIRAALNERLMNF